MKNTLLTFLIVLLFVSPVWAQFASGSHEGDHGDFIFARTTYGKPMFDPQHRTAVNDAGTLRLGATLGFLLTRLKEEDYDITENRFGVQFGLHAQYFITEQFALLSGLMLAFHGTNFENADDYHYNLTSLLIPILAGYYVIPQLMLMAGLQPGFILSSEDSENNDLKDFLKGFDLGFKFGVAYNLTEAIMINLAYTMGITDLVEDDSFEVGAIRNRMLQVGITYFFRDLR